jgi:hypothetical protein
LTASTLIVSGLFFLFQQLQDLRLLVMLTIPITLMLLVGGIALAKRIQETDTLKERYNYAINLIRNYFIDNDPQISEYLFLRFDATKLKVSNLIKIGFLLRSTLLWDSFLLGYIITASTWVIASHFPFEFLIGIGVAITLLTFVLLNYLIKRRIEAE